MELADVYFSDRSYITTEVMVDKMGRVHVPVAGFERQKSIRGIDLQTGQLGGRVRRVVGVSSRYTGDAATSLVCELED